MIQKAKESLTHVPVRFVFCYEISLCTCFMFVCHTNTADCSSILACGYGPLVIISSAR